MYLSRLERFRGALLGAELGYRLSRSPDAAPVWMGEAQREAIARWVRGEDGDRAVWSETPLFGVWLMALLFHDDSHRLRDAVDELLKPPPSQRSEVLGMALTAAAAIGDRLDLDFLAETFAQQHLDPESELTPLRQRLEGRPTREADESLLSRVLYAVLSCGGNWPLAVARLRGWERHRTRACILAGGLCGAWRTRVSLGAVFRASLDNGEDLDAAAWLLWQRWAGRLEFQPWDGRDRIAWGPPGTLRPRRSRRSQPPRLR
ncbi:hypothetical protein [Baaleninema sp.]|uniref:hypothetical protein n=1 Tax=Baaleninema sp. TaxID=3101197 RepID=UPI003D04399E